MARPLPHAHSASLLVFAPYVDPAAARVLIEAGVSYADALAVYHALDLAMGISDGELHGFVAQERATAHLNPIFGAARAQS
ncbi:MAG TPA: hypothetical protein VI299_02430 [Polyangiales bacterium]